MALDSEEVMDVKQNFDVCEMGCQCCVFLFNLVAFGLWTQLGTMYQVLPYDRCEVAGGDIECEYLLTPESAEKYFTPKVYTKNGTLLEFLVTVASDSPITSLMINGSSSVDYGSSTDTMVGLDEYTATGLMAAAIIVACVGMAMRMFDKAMSYQEGSFFVKKGITGFLMVMTTALAGTLSSVSCEEVGHGIWESSIMNMSIYLWMSIACGLLFGACAACSMYMDFSAGVYAALCCGGFMLLYAFIASIVIIIQTTVGLDGEINWSLAIEKIGLGVGNDCIYNGGPMVGGIRACVIIAFGCGIFQKIVMALFLCFSCTNSAARAASG